ncbi:hypothetical protein PBI_SCTP2_443 [Salicola phage SCTP-2]|nr:hypothetical protein PBI_SCTP2_443 [Salicola phage SCTP-2]
MNDQYDCADKKLIPASKTMEYTNHNNYKYVNYYKMFEHLSCIRDIMIPNIKNNCDCISALRCYNQRFVKAKLLEDEENVYKIALYNPSIEGIEFYEVSKEYFIIDEIEFLNYKNKDNSHKHYKKHWVL